jgi:hypothetical protein
MTRSVRRSSASPPARRGAKPLKLTVGSPSPAVRSGGYSFTAERDDGTVQTVYVEEVNKHDY